MASSRNRPKPHWVVEIIFDLMQQQQVSSAQLAERTDRPKPLIDSILDGTHVPSLILVDTVLNALGHELEVMRKK